MNSLDDLLNSLQKRYPVMDNEELFIEEIMRSLPNKNIHRRMPLWKAILVAASFVAILMFGSVYFNQQQSMPLLSHKECYNEDFFKTDVEYFRDMTPNDLYRYYLERKSKFAYYK